MERAFGPGHEVLARRRKTTSYVVANKGGKRGAAIPKTIRADSSCRDGCVIVQWLHFATLRTKARLIPRAKAASRSVIFNGWAGPDSKAAITHLACGAVVRAFFDV